MEDVLPRTSTYPSMYLDPPAVDIELEEFGTLPLCRLEAIRLLREGPTTDSHAPHPDARLLLLHGHGDRPSEAKHRRADLISHFVLRLACCGGNSGNSGNNGSGGAGDEEQPDAFSAEGKDRVKERREEEADRRRDRREWFVRAERDLFRARLHWHLGQAAGGGGAGAGVAEAPTGGRLGGGADDSGASEGHRLDALRIVYNLGWLQPVELAGVPCDAAVGNGLGVDGGSRGGRKSGGDGSGSSSSSSSSSTGGVGSGSNCRGGSGGGGSSSASGKQRRDGDNPFREEDPAPSSTAAAAAAAAAGGRTPATTAMTTPEGSFATPRSSAVGTGSSIAYLSCPFERVLPLVRSRQVPLRDGKALLSPAQVPGAVVQHFEERLRAGLAVAQRGLPGVEADERVRSVLTRVRKAVDAVVCGGGGSHGGDDRSSAVITRENIDQIAAKHFPLCMRRTLRILRREHHLKYQARLQLVSFLGNAGMEVGELLALWREEFPKGMPADEYARKRNQYEYSLRHLYGLEGKRKAYSSQSCARIASVGWGGSGEGGSGHGCPFHAHPKIPGGGGAGAGGAGGRSDTSVRGMLAAQNLRTADIEDIVGPLEASRGGGGGGGGGCGGGGALGACQRHFSATHRWAAAGGGGGWRTAGKGAQEASPNGWLAASTKYSQQQEKEQEERGAAAVAAGQGYFLTQQGQGV